MLKERPQLTFRAQVPDAPKLRAELQAGNATGDVDIVVAVFGVPDTAVAVGNTARQIIDKGAFTNWLAEHDFEKDPPLGFVDHGGAIETGHHSARLLLGYAKGAEETTEGLLLHTSYNLDKQVAREAYSDLVHNPAGVQFSFMWDTEKEVVELRDGEEHVTQLYLTEWSQVAFGAQRLAHLVSARKADLLAEGKNPANDTPLEEMVEKLRAERGRQAMTDKARATATAKSLEELPNKIRETWWEQQDILQRALGASGWIEEVFGETDTTGHVIARTDEGWIKVPWSLMDDGSVGFTTTDVTDVEREWVEKARGISQGADLVGAFRSAKGKDAIVAAMVDDPELARQMGQAAAAATEEDPLSEFYRFKIEELTTS